MHLPAPPRISPLLAGLALAACTAAEPVPAPDTAATPEPASMALRLTLSGSPAPVFPPDAMIPVELLRAGAAEPAVIEVAEGALTRHSLPPGRYAVSRIGPLACSGIGFELAPAEVPQALGTLQAELLQTDYDIALITASPPSAADLAALGPAAGQARLAVHRQALCHAGRGGPGTEFKDLSPAEQVLAVVFFAGFCAIAVASGGYCSF